LFPWPGGKRSLRKRLLALLPPHQAYVEVFAGSAKLLFAKEPSRWEIVNDVNEEVLNFFRVGKHRAAELAERLECECIHAARFRELRAAAMPLDELDRALRFAYLVWWSFAGKGEHFATMPIANIAKASRPVKRSLETVRGLLARAAQRLASVLIECRDFADCIRRYDRPSTFFYCDPPYTAFARNGRYEALGEERNRELFSLLARIRGRFLLSYNHCREVLDLARDAGFQVRNIVARYTLASGRHAKTVREVLIANFQLPARCGSL